MMRKWIMALALLAMSALSAPTHAQTVFLDDFDGDTLLPHWGTPPPSDWEYNLSNGMLNVTNVYYPSHPKSPTNFAAMAASFASQIEFQLDARMGWQTGETITRFDMTIKINAGLVATIGYRPNPLWGPTGIVAVTDAGSVAIPAPASGIYDFRMTRIGTTFHFYFEGMLFASLPSAYTGPVDGVQFSFHRPFPGGSGPFHIDRVQVQTIPAPATLLLLGMGAWIPRQSRSRS